MDEDDDISDQVLNEISCWRSDWFRYAAISTGREIVSTLPNARIVLLKISFRTAPRLLRKSHFQTNNGLEGSFRLNNSHSFSLIRAALRDLIVLATMGEQTKILLYLFCPYFVHVIGARTFQLWHWICNAKGHPGQLVSWVRHKDENKPLILLASV